MDRQRQRWLHRFEIKPDRWVYHPTDAMKAEGRRLKDYLLQRVQVPSNYWHLRKGGHVEALKSHINNRFFLKLDLADFFGSINQSRITRAIKPYCGYEKARQIARWSTVRHPTTGKYMLPYGFVQSPLLASIALQHSALGRYLLQMERNYGCIVSVYVDDILISAADKLTLEHQLASVTERAERSRFKLNHKKKQGPSSSISAFNIELSHNTLMVERGRLNAFREALLTTDNNHQRKGIVSYISSINVRQGVEIQQLPH